MSAQDVIAEALRLDDTESECPGTYARKAHSVIDALTGAGYRVVKAGDVAADMVAMADWQTSALQVIGAANQFLLDMVTGGGDPTILASALIETGFDQRFPEALAAAGYAVVKLPEPDQGDYDKQWLDGAVTCNPGYGKVRVYSDDPRWDTEPARDLAAALLAAANYSEAVDDD